MARPASWPTPRCCSRSTGSAPTAPTTKSRRSFRRDTRGRCPPGFSADVSFAVRLHVDTDVAMAAGREIGGFPKKLGHIEIQDSPMYFASLDSPKGLRICSGEMNPFAKVAEQRLLPPAMQTTVLPYTSLRVLPNPDMTRALQAVGVPDHLHRVGAE